MGGLSGLFRGPERRVNTGLNPSSVRVIYIITMLELSAVQVARVGISPMSWKHKPSLLWPVIPLFVHFQTAHAAEMLLAHCKRQHGQSSIQVSQSSTEASQVPRLGTSLSTSTKSSSQPLHCNEVVFLRGSRGGSQSR